MTKTNEDTRTIREVEAEAIPRINDILWKGPLLDGKAATSAHFEAIEIGARVVAASAAHRLANAVESLLTPIASIEENLDAVIRELERIRDAMGKL